MTRDGVLAWLRERRPEPPEALRRRLAEVVAQLRPAPSTPLPEILAAAGRDLLAQVAAQPQGGRELALDLLAADAFVTYAFEAQAESGVTGLARLAQERPQ